MNEEQENKRPDRSTNKELWGLTSFEAIEEYRNREEFYNEVMGLTYGLQTIIDNLAWNFSYGDKVQNAEVINAMQKAIADYSVRAEALIAEFQNKETDEQKSILKSVRSFLKNRIFPHRSEPKEEKSTTPDSAGSMIIWKEANGTYRWLAVYSNKFIDVDGDIISSKSHENFVEMVDKGEYDYPELWSWHIPGTAWGKADMVAFDKESGFACASGYVLPGHEVEAEAIMNSKEDIALSHGMPYSSIERDPDDPRVIVKHQTVEISDLPRSAAANKLTWFYMDNKDKEADMPIPEVKKQYLRSKGLTDDFINSIEAQMQSKSKLADELGMESKETEIEETETGDKEHEMDEKKDAPETVTEEVKEIVETKEETEEQPVEEQEVKEETDAITKAIEAIAESMTSFQQAISDLAERVGNIENSNKEIKESMALTPTASVLGMFDPSLSAVGNKDTMVAKNARLAKEGPEETPTEEVQEQIVSDPMLNSVLVGVIGSK